MVVNNALRVVVAVAGLVGMRAVDTSRTVMEGLHKAISVGQFDVARSLIAHHLVTASIRLLRWARFLPMTKLLLTTLQPDATDVTREGDTALHLVCRGGADVDAVRLVNQWFGGVHIHARNRRGQLPLHVASAACPANVVEYLSDCMTGSVGARDNQGQSAYDCLCTGRTGSIESARVLARSDATTVHVAQFVNVCASGQYELARFMYCDERVPLHGGVALNECLSHSDDCDGSCETMRLVVPWLVTLPSVTIDVGSMCCAAAAAGAVPMPACTRRAVVAGAKASQAWSRRRSLLVLRQLRGTGRCSSLALTQSTAPWCDPPTTDASNGEAQAVSRGGGAAVTAWQRRHRDERASRVSHSRASKRRRASSSTLSAHKEASACQGVPRLLLTSW